jgi:hypothetical protein
VAVTKAAMFVPEGSIRAGKVNDLVQAAEDKSISTYIAEGLMALIVIATLIPTGGATLGLAIGFAGAALSATTAVEDWESYKQHKMLTSTALDRAKALATEEPSLLPFAVDLISLGIDGLPLIKAFHAISELNRLVQARREIEEAARLKQLLAELDAIGAAKNKPGFGQQALDDLKRTSHPKPPARPPTAYQPKPPAPASTSHPKPPARRPSGYEPTLPKRPVWRKPPGGNYQTVEALGDAVDAPLRALTHGTADVNSEWAELEKLDWAKLERLDPAKAKLWEDTKKIFAARRDPDRIKRAILRIYREAGHEGVPPRVWLENHYGGASGMPALLDDGLDPEAFRDALGHDKPAIDYALAQTGHGAYIHMFDELLVEDVLGSREAAREYRQGLARMKGPAKVVPRGDGTTYEAKFFSQVWDAVFDSTDPGAINNADSLGEILVKYLGFLGRARP